LCCLGIPALVPVVEDVFLVRGASSTSSFDLKELETQREVLVSMLLRLVEYHQVSPLAVFIQCHNSFYYKNYFVAEKA
jgi:huntingtin